MANNIFFDSDFCEKEQLPRTFTVDFDTIVVNCKVKTRVSINGTQVGDLIDNNSREEDFYRFHDIFHYTFAALLGWSPCARAMMKRKRKSNPEIDEIEDGARAAITEEAISLAIFNKAKKNKFFEGRTTIHSSLLNYVKEMTASFEVAARSRKEWQTAILTGYSLFRDLINNNDGKVYFDMNSRTVQYQART